MSSAGENNTPNTVDVMGIESRAADWVADRRNSEDWTPERQAELDRWLAQSLAHRVAYIRIEATWRRTDRLAALHRPMHEPAQNGPLRRPFWMRVAAVFGLVVVTASFAGRYLLQPHPQLIETPIGGQERVMLADGSQIELNTDTAIRVDLTAQKRAVELVKGEAYFEIRHDAARPFVVTVTDHRIVDLGTKFLVRTSSQTLKVALVEGSARLENASPHVRQQAVILTPGDLAVATADSVRVSKRPMREVANALAWQRGAIALRNASLADAVAEFNRYGGPQIIVADPDTAKLTINGTFRTTGAEQFAGMTHEIFGLRVEHQNGNIVLSR